MVLAGKPTTAEMDSWRVVEAAAENCLFGFRKRHASTGGLSYVLSTPIVELDEAAGRARTQSGRVYALGRRIGPDELDEEGSPALSVLLGSDTMPEPERFRAVRWLTARKMARHLGVEAPPRSDLEAVERFLGKHEGRYLALIRRRRAH